MTKDITLLLVKMAREENQEKRFDIMAEIIEKFPENQFQPGIYTTGSVNIPSFLNHKDLTTIDVNCAKK